MAYSGSSHFGSSGSFGSSAKASLSFADRLNQIFGKGLLSDKLDGISSPTIDIRDDNGDPTVPVKDALPKQEARIRGAVGSVLASGSSRNATSAASPSGSPSATGVNYVGNGTSVNYLNADLAKAYGMDRNTAYQEALSNTAYSRAVHDMQSAGLNPAVLFGASAGSSASGVSYISPSGSVGASSAKAQHTMYKLLGNVGDVLGLVFGNRYLGTAGRALGNLIDGFGNNS